MGKIELDSASAGDVVSVTGAASAGIADTIGAADLAMALSPGPIEPPTLRYKLSSIKVGFVVAASMGMHSQYCSLPFQLYLMDFRFVIISDSLHACMNAYYVP